MSHRNRHIALLALAVCLLAPPSASCREALTDSDKKEIVYRMYAGYKKNFPAVSDISPREAMALQRDGKVLFVDTRKPEEIAVSRLPGAVSADDFQNAPEKYRDRVIVAYCTISYRSGLFAEKMKNQAITVLNLEGGILAWVLEGGTVYDDNGPTRRIHVYGPKWNYPASGYEAVIFGLWHRLLP